MVNRSLSQFRVLVVPGLNNSGPQHWQSRWQRLYHGFERVEQEHWDVPALAPWSQRLLDMLRLPSTRRVLLVAHSFGCLTTVHRALEKESKLEQLVAGALLVAPADPEKFGVSAEL